ncbi:MAG: hypothetical protein JW822_02375 [Spirochaetales bacterium]|nr:hypothetical protein [Spirochaetales bacterium]
MKKLHGFIFILPMLFFVFFSCTPPLDIDEMTYIEVSGLDGPGFAVNYADFGAGSQNAAFGIDNDGNIHITGTVNYTAASGPIAPAQTIFTLPAGYRPAAAQYFGITMNGFSNQFALITVLPNGNVAIGTSGNLDWFTFGHLTITK